MGHIYSAYKSPDTSPNYREDPSFDPLYGFPNGRKERVAPMSAQEMEAARLTPTEKDYCADHIVNFYRCRRDNYPIVVRCKSLLHKWEKCEIDDDILRLKEYERERRLLERAKRKKTQERKERSEILSVS